MLKLKGIFLVILLTFIIIVILLNMNKDQNNFTIFRRNIDLNNITDNINYNISNINNKLLVNPIFHNREKKIFISYVYFETEKSKKNLNFFLNNGIINNENIYYLITVNGYKCTLDLPYFENVEYIFRENKCYDIGTHGLALRNINIEEYDYFIFLNDSIRGPYINWSRNKDWVYYFIDKIDNENKLIGINQYKSSIRNNSHLQSMVLVTDKIGLSIILPIFYRCFMGKKEAVINGEYLISKTILKNNFKFYPLIKLHSDHYDTYSRRYDSIFYKTRSKFVDKIYLPSDNYYIHYFS